MVSATRPGLDPGPLNSWRREAPDQVRGGEGKAACERVPRNMRAKPVRGWASSARPCGRTGAARAASTPGGEDSRRCQEGVG